MYGRILLFIHLNFKIMSTFKKNVLFILLIGFLSCSKNEEYLDLTDNSNINNTNNLSDINILNTTLNLPENLFNYAEVDLPNFFLNNDLRREDNTPNNNLITNNGATLGRVLFYDKKLSINNTISCASCHDQSKGFSDSNVLSLGFNGGFTVRNSMGLANAKFYRNGRFFWDERASSLEEQVLLPIQDAVEMGLSLDELETKLQVNAYYKVLFRRAFGDENVTRNRVSLALAQFVRFLVSDQSKVAKSLLLITYV